MIIRKITRYKVKPYYPLEFLFKGLSGKAQYLRRSIINGENKVPRSLIPGNPG